MRANNVEGGSGLRGIGRGARRLALALALLSACGAAVSARQSAPCVPAVKEDRAMYQEPPISQVPLPAAAGGKFCDPTFGTEIMRVTDPGDGQYLGTAYSFWPSFNSNNTKLLIHRAPGHEALLKSFDPVSFTLVGTGHTLLPNSIPGHNDQPQWETANWSNTDPNVIYVLSYGAMIWKFDVTGPPAAAWTPLKDFSPWVQGKFVYHLTMSADDKVFAFYQRDGRVTNYVVWRATPDTVSYYAVAVGRPLNEVDLDKSGRYLTLAADTHPRGQNLDGDDSGQVLDLQTGQLQTYIYGVYDSVPGHGGYGHGFAAAFDPWRGGITRRRLDSIHKYTRVFDSKDALGNTDWTENLHATLLADNEDWMTLGTYDSGDDSTADYHVFEDELFQVALVGGVQRVRRFAHTRSLFVCTQATATARNCQCDPTKANFCQSVGYWATPRPNISKDGQFVAFSSNWEDSHPQATHPGGRIDMFVARIAPAPSISAAAPQGLAATGAAAGSVALSWTAPAPAPQGYRVERLGSDNPDFVTLAANHQGTTFNDVGAGVGRAFFYRVCAVQAAGQCSGYSNTDLATTFAFSDDPLPAAPPAPVKAVHITQLRRAVDAVRAAAGLPPASWSYDENALRGAAVNGAHINDLRDRLAEALGQRTFFPLSGYTGWVAPGVLIKKVHIEELRDALK